MKCCGCHRLIDEEKVKGETRYKLGTLEGNAMLNIYIFFLFFIFFVGTRVYPDSGHWGQTRLPSSDPRQPEVGWLWV